MNAMTLFFKKFKPPHLCDYRCLYSPDYFKQLSNEQLAEICNGCGSADSKIKIIPDTVLGLYVGAVCNIHDVMFHYGKPYEEDRARADRVYLHNLLRVFEKKGGWLEWPRVVLGIIYYFILRMLGGPAYWKGKNDADGA